jgi:hypothetical protein
MGVVQATQAQAGPCDAPNNAIVCENSKAGTPQSEWDIEGSGDAGLQGFATSFSVNVGETQRFKIKTTASAYNIDIYRLGWYGGDGARKMASVTPTARTQPNCITDAQTGLYDCGNWAVSASWTVPSDAVSGVYIAHLVNPSNQDESHITFVVRNDASTSDVVFQTSDSTWQAYNKYGGSDFYSGEPAGRAYKISYNRPFSTRGNSSGRDFLFSNEFPMLQFLERNGYDMSYIGSLDTDRRGALLKNHKVFVSTGHDEYWSGQQRANVESARDAGVSLAFFSGNEVYWKTRWEPSIDGTATDGRTLVCYKETWAGSKIDPSSEWTGTWRDPRFSPPSDGGRPENGLTGTAYMSNDTDLAITVGEREGKLRLWRNTSLSGMSAGQSTALAAHTIGYESDEDLDNAFRPQGLIRLSTTTGPAPEYLQDWGSQTAAGTTTHHLTLYRANSGALVFGAGTIQWAWGLSQNHDGDGAAADPRIQQATVNVLADMGATASTVMSGLVASTGSSDTQGPTTTITSPISGTSLANGTTVTVQGTATDSGGRVAGVEVSVDGGQTWRRAEGQGSWTYQATLTGRGSVSIRARAIDDSANIGAAASVSVPVSCPCSLFGDQLPKTPAVGDTSSVELGVKFKPQESGYVTAIRFYKGSGNTGTHTGSLWSSTGTLLATGTFTNETSTGWQTLVLPESVAVDAGTTYVASYRAPNGRYAADAGYFTTEDHVAPPLSALGTPSGETNGVYRDGSGFPNASYGATNYWVDVLFTVDDSTPPVVTNRVPLPSATSVSTAVRPKATFSRAITESSLQFSLKDAANATVPGTVSYDATTRTATFMPTDALTRGAQYTASVQASSTYGVPMDAPATWSFTTAVTDPQPGSCPCSVWTDDTVPDTLSVSDTQSVELGMKFKADVNGEIAGVKFYKGPQNLGTHTGSIWTESGTLLGAATFVGESSAGWQTVTFSTPVSVTAGTPYIVSYRAPVGGYAVTASGLSTAIDSPPLHTLANGGVYTYGTGAPTTTSSANYWVDVVFVARDEAPTVAQATPGDGATSVPVSSTVKATLAGSVQPGSAQLVVKDAANNPVSGTTAWNATTKTLTFTPGSALAQGQLFSATASGATALSGQQMSPYTWSFRTVGPAVCPCTLFDSTAGPASVDAGDTSAVSLGVKFSTTVPGFVTGVRFYKSSTNTGTHTGSLWTSTGTRLAQATFTNESVSGWQTVTFAQPVQLEVGQVYVASYNAPNGHYSASGAFFAQPWDNTVLTAPAGANGVYRYGNDAFPNESWNSSNYWVDPVFQPGAAPDTTTPTLTGRSPAAGSTSVDPAVRPSAVFSEDINAASLQMTLKDAAGQTVTATAGYDAATRTATLTPANALQRGATYTVSVAASDVAGNTMPADAWSFTTAKPAPQPGVCPCSLWDDLATPATITVNDDKSIELGLKFSADTDGYVTGMRFYKGPQNVGAHTGSLWSADGTRLATATFSGESTAGWQTVSFAQPVAVTAGTTYVVSYLSNGFYSATTGGLPARDVPPLHSAANAAVYTYGGGFPATSSTANYWVDVVFDRSATPPPAGDTTPPVLTAVAATSTGTSATITWATDESATTRVDYGTSPTALTQNATGATGTSHSVSLAGLTAGTTYYYRVTSADAAGNSTTDPVTGSAPRTFQVPAAVDATAPVLTAVTATSTGTSATITWTTDESATTRVDYGTSATALTQNATGATGTSHSVSLTGLTAGTTYHYRVTSADAAGNSTTDPVTGSAPRTFQVPAAPDTTPPVVSAVASSGSGTSATVSWTTDEAATTRVDYGISASTLNLNATGATGTSHSVALTGLTPNTRYYYRVTSTDTAGNSTVAPATSGAPAAYVPAVAPVVHSTVADFSTGSGGYVADTSGGEIMSAPALGTEFTGTVIPSGWTNDALVTGGTTTVAGGSATVSGSRLRTTSAWSAGRSLTAALELRPGQSVGWGSIANRSTGVTASFALGANGALTTRVSSTGATTTTSTVPGTWTGKHEYRIDWTTGTATFLVDGTQVGTGAFSPSVNLRVMLVDPLQDASTLVADWVRVAPYNSSSTFTSAVIDGGAVVGWDTLTRDVSAPTGTTLVIRVRSGATPTPGTGWTAWATVNASSSSITRNARYLQYRVQMTSTGTRFVSPATRGVEIRFHVL